MTTGAVGLVVSGQSALLEWRWRPDDLDRPRACIYHHALSPGENNPHVAGLTNFVVLRLSLQEFFGPCLPSVK